MNNVIPFSMEENKPSERHITLGLIIGWSLGVLFILTGAAQLVSDPIAAALLVLAGFISIPPTNIFLRKQFNINLSFWVRILLALVLIVIAGSMAGKEAIKATNSSGNQEQESVKADGGSPPATAKSYQQIFTFSGKGTKQSEPFTITGDRFKITYDCHGDLCSAFLHEVGRDLPKGLIMNTTGSASDETIFYGGGEYYIDANMMATYQFSVEDYR